MVAPAITNLVVMLIMMQVARKLPLDDPEWLIYLRSLYISSNVFIFGLYFYISTRVKSKNDTTTLKFVEPKSPLSQDPAQLVTTTVRDYDLQEVSKATRGVFTGIAMMAFLHLYLKYTQPLLLQSLLPIKAALESKPALIYIWGKKAEGELKRPWKAASPFAGVMGGGNETTATGEAAEVPVKAASSAIEGKSGGASKRATAGKTE